MIFNQIKKDFICLQKGKSDYLKVVKYNNFLKDKKGFAEIDNKRTEITVLDIDNDNCLICELNGKKQKIFSGEITFHL